MSATLDRNVRRTCTVPLVASLSGVAASQPLLSFPSPSSPAHSIATAAGRSSSSNRPSSQSDPLPPSPSRQIIFRAQMRISTSLLCIFVGSIAVQATEEGSPDDGNYGYGWRWRNRQRPTSTPEYTDGELQGPSWPRNCWLISRAHADHSTPREYPTEVTYPGTSSTFTSTTTSRASSSTSRSTATTTRSPAPTGAPTGGPYTLTRSYSGATFFDQWKFFQQVDPTEVSRYF